MLWKTWSLPYHHFIHRNRESYVRCIGQSGPLGRKGVTIHVSTYTLESSSYTTTPASLVASTFQILILHLLGQFFTANFDEVQILENIEHYYGTGIVRLSRSHVELMSNDDALSRIKCLQMSLN